jgi:hypothetical protein
MIAQVVVTAILSTVAFISLALAFTYLVLAQWMLGFGLVAVALCCGIPAAWRGGAR